LLTPDDFKPEPMRDPDLERKISAGKQARDDLLKHALELAGQSSPERQSVLKDMKAQGIAPELMAVRMIQEIGAPEPIGKVVERTPRNDSEKGLQRLPNRSIERGREAPGLER
jgi:hypothetical protein